MKLRNLVLAVSLALAAPMAAQAALLQIDDYYSDVLGLTVDGNTITDSNQGTYGVSNFHTYYAGVNEKMTFSFALPSGRTWAKDYNLYTVMGGESEDLLTGLLSDVFFFQATNGGSVANLTFYSVNGFDTYAQFQTWVSGLSPSDNFYYDANSSYSQWASVTEKDTFLTVMHAYDGNTGGIIDTYQVRSDAPEPASLALAGLGLAGLIATRRRKMPV